MSHIDPLSGSLALTAYAPDDEVETPPLPREHPKWVKDALAVSQRARRLIAGLRPIVIHVLTFWDHGTRAIRFGNQELRVDTSGSYRLE